MSFWEDDVDIFFADFGVPCVLTRTGYPTRTIQVLFDKDFVGMQMMGLSVESAGPQALCKSSDVSDITPRSYWNATIAGADYAITGIEPDGTGMTRLVLTEG